MPPGFPARPPGMPGMVPPGMPGMPPGMPPPGMPGMGRGMPPMGRERRTTRGQCNVGFDPLIKLSNHGYEASTASTRAEFGAASATAAKCQVRWISSPEVADQHGFRSWWQLAKHARRHDAAGHVQRHESRGGHERWRHAAELGWRHAIWRRARPAWKLYTAVRQLPWWAPQIEQLWQWERCLQTRSSRSSWPAVDIASGYPMQRPKKGMWRHLSLALLHAHAMQMCWPKNLEDYFRKTCCDNVDMQCFNGIYTYESCCLGAPTPFASWPLRAVMLGYPGCGTTSISTLLSGHPNISLVGRDPQGRPWKHHEMQAVNMIPRAKFLVMLRDPAKWLASRLCRTPCSPERMQLGLCDAAGRRAPMQKWLQHCHKGEFPQNLQSWELCTMYSLMSPYISLHLRNFWDKILKKSPDPFHALRDAFVLFD
eukprot:s2349_g5.t1